MVPSQEDEWKLMVDQDSHSGSVAGDSGHAQWLQLGKMNPPTALKNSLRQWVESMKVSPLSIFLMLNGEIMTLCLCSMMRMYQTPNTSCCLDPSSDMGRRQGCFLAQITPWKKALLLTVNCRMLSKTALTCLKPNYNDAKLVRYTQPSLVNVIPWIKYEAQNMSEPNFRQELQCIKEVEHL